MDCPKCYNDLRPLQINAELEIDHCPDCGGLWFDKEEIESELNSPEKFLEHLRNAYENAVDTECRCPRDASKMIQITLEEIPLSLEACETCGGLWFDKGEVQRLNHFLENGPAD